MGYASGITEMALGKGHQAIQASAIGKSKWNKDKKRVEIVMSILMQNVLKGVKALDWINGSFKEQINKNIQIIN